MTKHNEVTVNLEGIKQLYHFAIVPRIGDSVEVRVLSSYEGEIFTDMVVSKVLVKLDTVIITLKPSNNNYTLLCQS